MSQGNHTNYFVHTLLRARDWQHRPEFDHVCDWWRAGGKGVCGLVGMGGAGKTAIADRFLRVLPGVLPEETGVAKDRSLQTPNSMFVFSFYRAPNPEAFFEALHIWLAGTPNIDTDISYHQLIFKMQNAGEGLMILDGLEKVQEDGAKGILGHLSSPNLRDLINRLASSYLPNLSVLITTRFRLADLHEVKPSLFKSIPIEEIDIQAGIQLLRGRGVSRGSNSQLEQIVKACGQHALTIDFAGGYIKEYGDGDPTTPLNLGTADELQQTAEEEQDDDRQEVLKQGFRFARVAQRYREAMLENDEAAIALLERICLFRLGVDCKTLAAIFTGPDATRVSGKALASLDADQLQKKLDWLVRMRIVEQSESSLLKTLYSIHPAVRDGFLSGIGREAEVASRAAICQGLKVSLDSTTGASRFDPATLDLLEDIVYQAIGSRQVDEAWNIYQTFEDPLLQLGAYERGERICREFAAGVSPEHVAARIVESGVAPPFALEWARWLTYLGRLDAAARLYEVLNHKLKLCDVLLRAGRLPSAQSHANQEVQWTEAKGDDVVVYQLESYARRAHARAVQGVCHEALNDFDTFLDLRKKNPTAARRIYGLTTIPRALLAARLGRSGQATTLVQGIIPTMGLLATTDPNLNTQIDLIHSDLDLARKDGDLANARDMADETHEWALAHDAKELLCWSALVRGRIELRAYRDSRSEDADKASLLERSKTALEDGLWIARDCGYGIYHIDLLLVRIAVVLHEGRADDALYHLDIALDQGIHHSGQPELLAANDPECGYAWGIAEGLHLRGEALLLKAAQTLGDDSFVPAKCDQLIDYVRKLIADAEINLNEALDWWRKLKDPDSNAEMNYRGWETQRVLDKLRQGMLTAYPLEAIETAKQDNKVDEPMANVNLGNTAKPVFISYAHEDNETKDPKKRWIDRLLVHLQLLQDQDELTVCSDQDIPLGTGWHDHIHTHLNGARAAVLLVSGSFLASEYVRNSELPVLLRNAKERGVIIIPVVLSPCLFTRAKFKFPNPKSGPEEFTLASLQAAGSPDKTLIEMDEAEQERTLIRVAERLLEIVQNP